MSEEIENGKKGGGGEDVEMTKLGLCFLFFCFSLTNFLFSKLNVMRCCTDSDLFAKNINFEIKWKK